MHAGKCLFFICFWHLAVLSSADKAGVSHPHAWRCFQHRQCADQSLGAQIYGLPTLMLFRDGEPVEGSKREGAIGKKGIISWMESNGVTNPQ